ncbi:MAG: DNA polymerase III subunit beta [Deltaproteobacteria bacterium]|nr:DNA polymerase III subunit beta [Deltaproteobacteria bacterium]TLN03863.1 MAG: DNA polymerase III subunit beta [bacterium]
MEFAIAKESFLKALQRVQGIIENRKTMPILSNVLISAQPEKIEIIATDLEVGMKSSFPADVTKAGKITVSAKKLYEIIKELPEEEIHFSTRENDWVDLRCGKAHFNLVGLSPEEFPFFPAVNDSTFLTIKGSLIRELVEMTAFAICHDETKYNLNGIFIKALEEEGKTLLRMVATDGHRLAMAEKEIASVVSSDLKNGVIFPKKGIFELKKMTDDDDSELMLSFLDNSAVVKKNDTVVVMRLVDGYFPDYTRVMPADNDKLATIRREDFIHSLRRMAILSSEKFKGIMMELKNGIMEISASNPELGDARETLEVNYEGPDLAIRFNARYLLDSLSVMGQELVTLALKDELSPAVLKPYQTEDFLTVIMPMRV